MQHNLSAVLNTDLGEIVYLPIENRLIKRYLSKHRRLDITTITDRDYQRVQCIVDVKESPEYANRNFFVDWVKEHIKSDVKLNEEGLALLYDNMTFDGNCIADIIINIESTLAGWHTATVEGLVAKYDLDTEGMDEEDAQTAVINHLHDGYDAIFEGVISEGDDYLIVYSDLAGATNRSPKKARAPNLPTHS